MIDRKDRVLRFARKEQLGLEIAPFHSPLAPKRDGWNCLSLDIYDEVRLRAMAAASEDPVVRDNLANIEKVDIVAPAGELRDAVARLGRLGQFDYICSSHNFEHLPNPIRFLRDCGEVLKPGGYLSMAIPDKRKTFDYARPLTGLKDFLESWLTDRKQPSAFQLFETESALMRVDGEVRELTGDPVAAYEKLLARMNGCDYVDAHVSVFTRESFMLLLAELLILQLIPLRPVLAQAEGIEFFVHLRNDGYAQIASLRPRLLKARSRMLQEAFAN